MNFKRVVAAAASAVMGASLLAGCGSSGSTDTTTASGSSSSSSGSVSMTFTWWGNQTRNEETQNAITAYENDNPGVTIDGQFSQWSDYWQKLATESAGDSLPDILQMDYQYITQYADSDLLLDLTPYVEDGTLDTSNWDSDMISAGTIDGKFVGVCAGMNAPALIYNKDVTDAAGVTIKDNMTLDEFIEVCKTIKEKTGYRTDCAYGTSLGFIEYLLRGDGIQMFGDGKLNVTAEELAKYFQFYADGMEEGWMIEPGVYAEISIGSVEQSPMVYGSDPDNMSWCTLSWSNQYVSYMNAANGANLGITTWPSNNVEKSQYIKPGQFFSISSTTENPEEAVKFLNWLINSEEANDYLKGERGIPINSEIADYVKGQLSEDEVKVYDYVYDVVMPNSSEINPPYPDGYSEVDENLNSMIEQVAYGAMTAEEAAEKVVTEGNASLAEKASSSS
ncbi:MAG: ABC transporter substrate-binding protein [Lachnospiraceae bacterium]